MRLDTLSPRMRTVNTGRIVIDLRDVDGRPIAGKAVIQLRNQRLSQLDRDFRVELEGQPLELADVPAHPNGLARLTVTPHAYRSRTVIVDVPPDRAIAVRHDLFADPRRTKPVFPAFAELATDLLGLLGDSGIGAAEWEQLHPGQRAGFMNVHAKARSVELGDLPLSRRFRKAIAIKPARSYFVADPVLHREIAGSPLFRRVPGGVHSFPEGWQRLDRDSSFKTREKTGNIQLTFASDRGGEGLLLADVDIDDHAGIRHAFDVMKHKLTGRDSHPIDIHQILKRFQGIDPGYRVVSA